jgi:hypothetical protein
MIPILALTPDLPGRLPLFHIYWPNKLVLTKSVQALPEARMGPKAVDQSFRSQSIQWLLLEDRT